MTYAQLFSAFQDGVDRKGDQGVSPLSVSAILPLEEVRVAALFDADVPLVRPGMLKNQLTPAHWISLMNSIDVEAQLLFSAKSSPLELVHATILQTMLPDVDDGTSESQREGKRELWVWEAQDESVWCSVDSHVEEVSVPSRSQEEREASGIGAAVDGAKLAHLVEVILQHYHGMRTKQQRTDPFNYCLGPQIILMCSYRREQDLLQQELLPALNSALLTQRQTDASIDESMIGFVSSLRLTISPEAFALGNADVLLLCDAQLHLLKPNWLWGGAKGGQSRGVQRDKLRLMQFSIPREWLTVGRSAAASNDSLQLLRQSLARRLRAVLGARVRASTRFTRIPMHVLFPAFQVKKMGADSLQALLQPLSEPPVPLYQERN